MGAQVMIDLIGSIVVFGWLLLMSLRVNTQNQENMQTLNGDLLVQENLVAVTQLLEMEPLRTIDTAALLHTRGELRAAGAWVGLDVDRRIYAAPHALVHLAPDVLQLESNLVRRAARHNLEGHPRLLGVAEDAPVQVADERAIGHQTAAGLVVQPPVDELFERIEPVLADLVLELFLVFGADFLEPTVGVGKAVVAVPLSTNEFDVAQQSVFD